MVASSILSNAKDSDPDDCLPVLIDKLRFILKGEENLLKYRSDEEFLAKFIRVRNYDVKRARDGILKYYKNIDRNQDLITDIKPSQFIPVFDAKIAMVLKGRDKFGSRVGLARLGAWDTGKFNIRQIQLATLFQAEQAIQEKDTQLNGAAVIFDMKNLSLQHIRQLSATEIRRIIITAQEGLPLKVAAVHFINYPSIFWALYYVVQGFLKEKIRKRTHLHSSVESLHEYFSPEMLPISLGGKLEIEEAMDDEIVKSLLEKDKYYDDYFQ